MSQEFQYTNGSADAMVSSPDPELSNMEELDELAKAKLSEKEPNRMDLILKLVDVVKQFRSKIETTIQVLVYAYIVAIWSIVYESGFKASLLECVILVLGAFYQLLDILCSFYVYLRLKPLPKKREDNECTNKESIEAYNKVSKVANWFLLLKIAFAIFTSILFIVYVVSSLKITC